MRRAAAGLLVALCLAAAAAAGNVTVDVCQWRDGDCSPSPAYIVSTVNASAAGASTMAANFVQVSAAEAMCNIERNSTRCRASASCSWDVQQEPHCVLDATLARAITTLIANRPGGPEQWEKRGCPGSLAEAEALCASEKRREACSKVPNAKCAWNIIGGGPPPAPGACVPEALAGWSYARLRQLGARIDAKDPSVWGDCLLPSPVERAAETCAAHGPTPPACAALAPACAWLAPDGSASTHAPKADAGEDGKSSGDSKTSVGGRCGLTPLGATASLFGADSAAVDGAALCSKMGASPTSCRGAGKASVSPGHIRKVASGGLRALARGPAVVIPNMLANNTAAAANDSAVPAGGTNGGGGSGGGASARPRSGAGARCGGLAAAGAALVAAAWLL